jgi:hypothetical protein
MLRWLISAVGFAALKGEFAAAARRTGRRAALSLLAMVLSLAAIGFLIAALTVWLTALAGPIWACIVVAAGLLLAALIIAAGLAIAANQRARQSPIAAVMPGGDGRAPDLGTLGVFAIIGVAAFLLGRQFTRH